MPDCYELCQIVIDYARLLWIMPDCYKFCQIVTFRDKLSTTRFLSYWFKKLWGWTVNDQWKGSIPNEIVDIKVSLFRTLSMIFFKMSLTPSWITWLSWKCQAEECWNSLNDRPEKLLVSLIISSRNRQSVFVKLIFLSLALLRTRDCLFLKPVTERDWLLLRPIIETHCLFSASSSLIFVIWISYFRGEGKGTTYFIDE